jgi:hypothetical protein
MTKPIIYVGMPRRDETCHAGAMAGLLGCATGDRFGFTVDWVHSSLLTHAFNTLYAKALNMRESHGVTHFAMIHSDIVPDAHWLDVLYLEMGKYKADLISAVVPVRGDSGMTSTAVETGDPWAARPLSLKECFDYPETWTSADLLVNTGLMLLDLNASKFGTSRRAFHQQDRVVLKNDKHVAETIPEDWDFSRQVRGSGGRVYATRKVGLYHGTKQCHNRSVWGK